MNNNIETIQRSLTAEQSRLQRELRRVTASLISLAGGYQVSHKPKPAAPKPKAPRAKAGELAGVILSVLTEQPATNGVVRELAQAKLPRLELDSVKVYKTLLRLKEQGRVEMGSSRCPKLHIQP